MFGKTYISVPASNVPTGRLQDQIAKQLILKTRLSNRWYHRSDQVTQYRIIIERTLFPIPFRGVPGSFAKGRIWHKEMDRMKRGWQFRYKTIAEIKEPELIGKRPMDGYFSAIDPTSMSRGFG
jgi:hypothetical protein